MNSNWSYNPETPNLGQIRRFLEPCDLEIWWMTLKNNRAPLLSNIKLCASFHCHMWIQTGVTVRKRLSGVLTSVTLTFDLWPWSFAWTSLLSMVITSGNFMMIRWQQHSEKGVTDRQTDGRTDWTIDRAAWSQLKMGKWPDTSVINNPCKKWLISIKLFVNMLSSNVPDVAVTLVGCVVRGNPLLDIISTNLAVCKWLE